MPATTSDGTGRVPFLVGLITHRYKKINCAAIKISGVGFQEGDELLFTKPATVKGAGSFFNNQVITSIELDHSKVMEAVLGQEVAVKLDIMPPNGATAYVLKKPDDSDDIQTCDH
jgi:hypothetical protein